MLAWLDRRSGTLNDFVFSSRNDYMRPMSATQYARLVRDWVIGIGLQAEDYSTHSLRRTKASIIYKATGSLREVQILLDHTKIESTVRYLSRRCRRKSVGAVRADGGLTQSLGRPSSGRSHPFLPTDSIRPFILAEETLFIRYRGLIPYARLNADIVKGTGEQTCAMAAGH